MADEYKIMIIDGIPYVRKARYDWAIEMIEKAQNQAFSAQNKSLELLNKAEARQEMAHG